MKLLNIREAAKILGFSPRTLYQWRWQGKDFPFVKLGRALRISEDDLIKFIVERRSDIKKDTKAN